METTVPLESIYDNPWINIEELQQGVEDFFLSDDFVEKLCFFDKEVLKYTVLVQFPKRIMSRKTPAATPFRQMVYPLSEAIHNGLFPSNRWLKDVLM